jgi:beta-glucosidase
MIWDARYMEKAFMWAIGYRYYEFAEKDVNFPFGHGLSYTTFSFSNLQIMPDADKVRVTFKIQNTGSVRGAEVAQLHIKTIQSAKVNRPVKELKGFAKVELGPGEVQEVSIAEEQKYLASYFDEERITQWCVEAGDYGIIVSNSSIVTPGTALEVLYKVDTTY